MAVFAKTPGLELAGVEFIPVEDTTRLSYGVAYMADELTPLLRRLIGMLAAESAKYDAELTPGGLAGPAEGSYNHFQQSFEQE